MARVLEMLRALPKDNSGYDLKQIFIGAKARWASSPPPACGCFPSREMAVTAFAAVPSPAAALKLLGQMQARTGGLLSAFELIPRIALEFVTRHIPGTRDPLAAPSPWYVLMEATGGSGRRSDGQFRGRHWRPRSPRAWPAMPWWRRARPRPQALWKLRESISEAQKREGASIKHDISVPVAAIPAFLPKPRRRCWRYCPARGR